ncbi:hypothetical protein [Pseudomonas anguilliseptica]|uniref:hypothetical protein n=1 Tax=Pseudomonas anguilliseptica TaxID=53406 RepID=UPI001F1DB492|nr:hypothetical protein [Pseudomonas anguilliseptica]MCE5364447.1 hypothetical protein [Pseudomonas anguilliseptica]
MLIFGMVVTILWVLGFSVVFWLNFDTALQLGLNEWGDFLAGSFAPMAFFWLVIGYFQQSKELRLSTEALRMQAEELRNSVEQQKELVKATQEDIAFAKAEAAGLRRERKKMAQPIFSLDTSVLQYFGVDDCELIVYLHNYGSDIKEVCIDVRSEMVGQSFDRNNKQGKWKRDEDMTLWFEFKRDNLEVIDCFECDFLYLDGLGEKCVQRVLFNLERGKVVSLAFLDVV